MSVGSRTRDPETTGRFFDRQPGEEAQLDQLGLLRVLGRELVERLIQGQKIIRRRRHKCIGRVQVNTLPVAAPLAAVLAAGVIDEDRYFGNEDRWSMAFYTYSHEKYEPCVFGTGRDHGTPEEAFETAAVYLLEA